MEAEVLPCELINDVSFKKPQVRTCCKHRNIEQLAAVRNVACLAADAVRKAVPATAQQIIIEKAVQGTAVRYKLAQVLIARNANRRIRLSVGINNEDGRSLCRKRFSQCDDR